MALLSKKQRKLWIWLAYSRTRRKITAIELGSRGRKTLVRLWAKIAKLNPKVVYTDKWKIYRKIIPNEILTQSKRFTHNIESQNSSLRDRLRRFTRKSKAYSKCKLMAELSVYIHFFGFLIKTMNI